MKTRSLWSGIAIAIIAGMIFAGGVTIADAEREDRRRQEHKQYDGSERRFHWETVLGYYQNMWFHTTFVLKLDDNTFVRARDVYSRALHDIHESKNTKGVKQRFNMQLKKTIGDDNFNKLMESSGRKRFFSRKNIKIGEQGRGRSRRSRASEKKRESRNRGSDKKGGDKTGTHKTKNQKKS